MSKENVAEQQELEFETEVDVKEETEEAPQEAEAEAPTEEKEASNDDELSEYSKNVQDRIRKITQKYRKEESERKAAIEYAEAVQKQNKEHRTTIIEQRTTTVGLSWKKNFKNGNGFTSTALSSNRLGNVFSRYLDNVNKTGIIFQNDSYEWETKLRFSITQFVSDWKWSAGFNVQNSNYMFLLPLH